MTNNEAGTSNKQAACLNCRKSKIKCRREEDASICERCAHVGTECVIPEFHIGRQKGVKNKRSGLEKAIYQVEEAIKKRKADNTTNLTTLEHLKKLLGEKDGEEKHTQTNHSTTSPSNHVKPLAEKDVTPTSNGGDDQLEGVENPLQLLARASDLRIASPLTPPGGSISTPGTWLSSEHGPYMDVQRFFLPMKANLDQGPGLDPIEVGLVTFEEAEMLLAYFHKHLAHTRWGLDPLVHTTHFVRSRSAFLFTTLLAMTAIFLPETGALAKRLLLHRRFLAEQVIVRKSKSVEIILAFMVSIPWLPPGSYASDDDTSLYLATSLSIALDLSLDKILTPSSFLSPDRLAQIPRADCLDAKRALSMDGFEDIDPGSEWGMRLLRRRERVWIALFVLERGVCLARGRSYCIPKTSLILNCDEWHNHASSYVQDGPLVSMAVLRRDLDDLFANVRSRCDNHRTVNGGPKAAQEIDWAIESFFDQWSHTWTSVIGNTESKTLPPYVEILVTHTRLSTYSMLLNHPTAPPEVKRSFRASALSSALNVMRAAIQGESRLNSMPNNTVTMICFAASIALALSAPVPGKGGNQNLAPSVRHLIEETATVLERIGSTPIHRNGSSVVYGRFLRVLVKQAPDMNSLAPSQSDLPAPEHAQPGSLDALVKHDSGIQNTGYAQEVSNLWPQPLDFSAMSYNEVNETVTNSDLFSTAMLDLPWDSSNQLMWTDWLNLPDFNFP
ncbi:hypothetical protein HBH47_233060 [Parastagonospora nodorum]|nr:hypothetical protein HBH47_233060 [Parastagonospora nodorum]KAH5312389.1 hypothetical protein HBI12_138730 [Parastagonospora nodorum]KAH6360312.1 hypothetical protein HBI34_198620 [Parastagonospora nodorum]